LLSLDSTRIPRYQRYYSSHSTLTATNPFL
jgi:hypothetical protein